MSRSVVVPLDLKRGQKPHWGIVIPAFNEREALPKLLAELKDLIQEQTYFDFTVIVVDDGSSDDTLAWVRSQTFPFRLVSLRHVLNLGIGRTVQTGVRYAHLLGLDGIVQLDGDGQHPPAEVRTLLEAYYRTDADVVVGSRYVDGSRNVSSRLREAATRAFGLGLNLVGLDVRDTTSGFRAYGARALPVIAYDYPDDYPEVEILVILARLKMRVSEVPVQMRRREYGRSSIQGLSAIYYVAKVAFSIAVGLLRPMNSLRASVKRPSGVRPSAASQTGNAERERA